MVVDAETPPATVTTVYVAAAHVPDMSVQGSGATLLGIGQDMHGIQQM